MATIFKPKMKKRATSFALSPDLVKKVDDLSRATKRSRSELAETFLEMGLETFEKQVDTDALLYDARKHEKDVFLKDCAEIIHRLQKLSKA
ncbi:MAG TPA: ribbon-helix-helix protein, CopG family [Nitrospiraceae bacterium]|nr:ribbon-helix-helix protein, CopG family [Nitrospiraceae bacterium]